MLVTLEYIGQTENSKPQSKIDKCLSYVR